MRATPASGGQPLERAFRRTPGPSLARRRSCAKSLSSRGADDVQGVQAGQPNWCPADCSSAVCPPVLAALGVPGFADFEDAGDRFAGKGGAVVAVGPDACPE